MQWTHPGGFVADDDPGRSYGFAELANPDRFMAVTVDPAKLYGQP